VAVAAALAIAVAGTAAATGPTEPNEATRTPVARHFPTGLDRPFPPVRGEAPTAARAALGRLLFFDPVLSRDGDLSCAHCHHPQHVLADGRRRARGRAGVALERNTPSLYEAGTRNRLFWDQRARDLESQALGPLLSPREMAARPGRLVARLRAIAAYRARFAEAFPLDGNQAIGLANITRALAAFERTLRSRDSRYDRYARGQRDALSASERRGLTLLRSLHTRCFECHPPPAFRVPFATGIGTSGSDDGVGAVTGNDAQRGFFNVPSLRNVARTAPYMHDGSISTLEGVVRFYMEGGGRAHGVDPARIDPQIRAFALDDGEVADLVAFLGALSDESQAPSIPDTVPSGLPVVAPLPAPAEEDAP